MSDICPTHGIIHGTMQPATYDENCNWTDQTAHGEKYHQCDCRQSYTTGEIQALVAPLFEEDAGNLGAVLVIAVNRKDEILTYGTVANTADFEDSRLAHMHLASMAVAAMSMSARQERRNAPEQP